MNTKFALGTVQFGLDYGISNQEGKTSPEEVSRILDVAFEKGIPILDTAQAYGDSETVLGHLHGDRFKIVTKINPAKEDSLSALQFVTKSLNKLKLERLYGLLFHSATSALQNPKIVVELKVLQEKGIIEKLGFSVYTPHELEELINHFGQPDIVQIPYSHIDRRFESIAQRLHQEGVEIHTRSTFLQGLFFKELDELPRFFDPVVPYLLALKNRFSSQGDLAQALLSYCLSKDFIDYVVLGVNTSTQLQDNLKAMISLVGGLPEPPTSVPESIVLPFLWPK